ncbi:MULTISPECIES: fumarate reductase subunit FrdD [Salinivibrio]|uniref:Fumarate reductase subunit D n=1 Tax=Salinivibrio siamensis TaxID=414286 RepID=A0ABX3KDH2_9GAMM|nr:MULTISPECIES: fumarate reductase subunit FrdD [Salinivibrio]KKA45200.1 fumarate reductase [Salinivibrio sp. KP-1]MPS32889.1 fumarate reductase subunit FrdD [Salinivibrio sp. VYel7]MPX91034.1 fumarate reductase subunit FrdD [Salinivibrio sp. VYel1]MPX94277.1 fumarate reductase subunit FrdD [Salinivibrio sp. VYel9]MPX97341.1 fumarate reductase subunit FrdD [Salinivibrio sp. VYel6]
MIDPKPKRSDEPIWWSLFGAGGTWFAMFTPVTVLILGVLIPLGVIDPSALSYDRVMMFADHWLGKLLILATLALPMWHAMHRIHHGLHDLKLHVGLAGKVVCYAIAFAVSIAAVLLVLVI